MDFPARELLVARLVAGCIRCRLQDVTGKERLFLLKNPDRYQRYIAQEVYQDTLRKGEEDCLLTNEEMLAHMVDEQLWSAEEEDKIRDLEKNLEELKVGLYQLLFKEYEQNVTRKLIATTNKELDALSQKKHAFDSLTREGAASIARMRYLVGASLCWPNGQPVFAGEDEFWSETNFILDQAFEVYAQARLSEIQVRELARTEPWRSLWSTRKAEGSVFGIPSADLSDEQKGLVTWSTLYDSVLDHPEAPTSAVIEDDDMLDGWLIIQRRQREKESEKSRAESLIGSEKIRNSEEVFVVADSAAGAKKIHELNDKGARIIKQKRMATVKSKGVVDERDMPDSKLKIQEQISREFAEHVRGGG